MTPQPASKGPPESGPSGAKASSDAAGGTRSRTSRRARFALRSAAILLAVSATTVAVNMVAYRLNRRIDVTALGEQGLSPRTKAALARLTGEFEIVLAGQWSAPEGQGDVPSRRARRQVFDLLTEMARTDRNLRVTRLDTLSESGRAEYTELLERLVERDRGALDASLAAVRSAADAISASAGQLVSAAAAIDEVARTISGGDATADDVRRRLADVASTLRIASTETTRRAGEAVQVATRADGPVPVGQIEEAVASLRTLLEQLDGELGLLSSGLLEQRDRTSLSPGAKDRLTTLAQGADAWRPSLRTEADKLSRLKRPDVLRIARFLTSNPAALIIGPSDVGMTAISFEALFPTNADDRPGVDADLRPHVEDLLTTALNSLTMPNTPIVVLTHAEGRAESLDPRLINDIRRRLELKRVTVLEWPALAQVNPPAMDNPGNRRPVVYAFIPTNATAVVPPGPNGIPPQTRISAWGQALRQVVDAGHPVLLTVAPSPIAGMGSTDESVAVLDEFGLKADVARTLLSGTQGPGEWEVASDVRAKLLPGDHPLQKAVGGLPMALVWSVAISPLPERSSLIRTPIAEVAEAATWNEAEWSAMWQLLTPSGRTRVRGAGAPVPNEGIDGTRGPWTVGYLSERKRPDGTVQRLAAVGAYQWFFDMQTTPAERVSGQIVLQNPGNAELFEAAVFWLAGQDDMLAPGPTVRAVARIRPMPAGQVAALQWGLIAGLPLFVLTAGVLVRVVRG